MHILTILMDYMGLTQAELAKKADISPADLNEMINKVPYGMITKYQRMAQYLCVSVDSIVNYTGMRPGELLSLEISTHIHLHGQQRYFKTGSKTDAGKNRIIPLPEILSKIVDDLIGDRSYGPLLATTGGGFYRLDNLASPMF